MSESGSRVCGQLLEILDHLLVHKVFKRCKLLLNGALDGQDLIAISFLDLFFSLSQIRLYYKDEERVLLPQTFTVPCDEELHYVDKLREEEQLLLLRLGVLHKCVLTVGVTHNGDKHVEDSDLGEESCQSEADSHDELL